MPSTYALSAPPRTSAASLRPPSNSPRPCTTIVLPAPVSPVTTLRPGDSSSSASSMTPKPWIRSSLSTCGSLASPQRLGPVSFGATGAAPSGDGQVELRNEPVGERSIGEPREPHRLVAPPHFDASALWDVERPPPVAPEHG